jgi:hypothetical protein
VQAGTIPLRCLVTGQGQISRGLKPSSSCHERAVRIWGI